MQTFFKILVNLGLAAFLVYTTLLVFMYVGALRYKITSAQYKNMDDSAAIYFGLLAIAFVIIDILIVIRFVRQLMRIGS